MITVNIVQHVSSDQVPAMPPPAPPPPPPAPPPGGPRDGPVKIVPLLGDALHEMKKKLTGFEETPAASEGEDYYLTTFNSTPPVHTPHHT